MNAITFEPTITAGLIFQTFVFGSGLFVFLWKMKSEISVIKADLSHLQDSQKALTEAFSQLGKILTQVAVQDTRINMIEKKIDELSHGQGYVAHKKGQ